MGVLDILFPKACFGCGKEGVYLCPDCLEKERLSSQICPRCFKISIKGGTHSDCLEPLGLDGLITFWRYRGAVRRAILAMKYKFASDIARELGRRLAGALKSDKTIKGKRVIIPIPIYKRRGNWRGFNQAEEIGKETANFLDWEFKNILVKVKPTIPQTGLSRRQREENLKGSFGAKGASISNYPNIILLDDVWTTGSTLKEACRILKEEGAEKIWGVAFARG